MWIFDDNEKGRLKQWNKEKLEETIKEKQKQKKIDEEWLE